MKCFIPLWLMLHLSITASILCEKLASSIKSFVYIVIAHSRNFVDMTPKWQVCQEELKQRWIFKVLKVVIENTVFGAASFQLVECWPCSSGSRLFHRHQALLIVDPSPC